MHLSSSGNTPLSVSTKYNSCLLLLREQRWQIWEDCVFWPPVHHQKVANWSSCDIWEDQWSKGDLPSAFWCGLLQWSRMEIHSRGNVGWFCFSWNHLLFMPVMGCSVVQTISSLFDKCMCVSACMYAHIQTHHTLTHTHTHTRAHTHTHHTYMHRHTHHICTHTHTHTHHTTFPVLANSGKSFNVNFNDWYVCHVSCQLQMFAIHWLYTIFLIVMWQNCHCSQVATFYHWSMLHVLKTTGIRPVELLI